MFAKQQGFLTFLLFTLLWQGVQLIEPITTTIAVGAAIGSVVLSIAGLTSNFQCAFNYGECCSSTLQLNITGLDTVLTHSLHGQPLVKDTIVRLLHGHLSNKNPGKPLSLSFHGWTGSGKNFVSRLMSEHIYRKGMKSNFVHLYVATVHFPHAERVKYYQDNLRKWIHGNVSQCAHSMFIFDEMDKMPNGLLDAIKPYLDVYDELDGVDYRKSIFIFLSNTAGHAINARTLKYWQDGRRREDITRVEMEAIISLSAFNEDGGLWHSTLIEKNMISAFIPFLPLERRHVKECVKDDMKLKRVSPITKEIVDKVLNELTFFPKENNLFSKSGCKRVPQKVDLIADISTWEDL